MRWNRKPEAGETYLDSVYDRILQGENIFIGDVLDRLNKLDGPAFDAVTPGDISAAKAARREFYRRINGFGLRADQPYQLCLSLRSLAQKAPSRELLGLVCDILCDTGLFLDPHREDRTEEQDALCWRAQKKDANTLKKLLSERVRLSHLWRDALADLRRFTLRAEPGAADAHGEAERIRALTEKAFQEQIPPQPMTDNLCVVLHSVSGAPPLNSLKPLFLYQLLTRHSSRMRTSEAPSLDFSSLWQYRSYKLDRDNGRNYDTAVRYLRFFEELCALYEEDPEMDLPLCVYGFERLSNLGEFYSLFPPEEQRLLFDLRAEELVSRSLFTCFAGEENPVLEQYGLSYEELDEWTSGCTNRQEYALKLLEKSINNSAGENIARFLSLPPQGRVRLCEELLSAAPLPDAVRPRAKEKGLFLAAVYEELAGAADEQARGLLCEALNSLTEAL